MKSAPWTAQHIPDQRGRTIIVTGSNAGIGFETAKALAHAGAHVVLACRDEERGQEAKNRIDASGGKGSTELRLLDLANLKSIRQFAAETGNDIDALINNAGVMIPPFGTTFDGFEQQIGVNFLGHYALTALLLEKLSQDQSPRIVTLTSIAYHGGWINTDRFRGGGRYIALREYAQSKLACLIFALELARRLERAGSPIASLAVHPGTTRSELQRHSKLFFLGAVAIAMPASQGALPSLYAATESAAKNGDFIGPDGVFETRGYPAPAKLTRRAKDPALAQVLFDAAAEMTGVELSV